MHSELKQKNKRLNSATTISMTDAHSLYGQTGPAGQPCSIKSAISTFAFIMVSSSLVIEKHSLQFSTKILVVHCLFSVTIVIPVESECENET